MFKQFSGEEDFDPIVLFPWSSNSDRTVVDFGGIPSSGYDVCSSKTRPLLPAAAAAKRLQFAVARDERTNRVTSSPLLPIPSWLSLGLPNPNFLPLVLSWTSSLLPNSISSCPSVYGAHGSCIFFSSRKNSVGTKPKRNPGQGCRTAVSSSDWSMRTVFAGMCDVCIGQCNVISSAVTTRS